MVYKYDSHHDRHCLIDWCLWAPQEPNSVVGNIEGEMVAWCTKKGHGTRIIPPGAITGMSWVQTSKYIQVTGMMNQTLINMAAGDSGGGNELNTYKPTL